jgi:peptidoglycan/xylan/chitin deacetylase (PgdA/CDA1 family)
MSGALAQSVALTFDDGLDPTMTEAAQWNKALLHALSAAKLQAMLIPAAKNVDSEAGRNLARAWGESGHWIGNHSYSHTNFGSERTAVSDFIADIERAEQILSPLPGWQPFFRFPYLKEGSTAERRDLLRRWLKDNHYGVASVSIDASDWYYNSRYLAWRKASPGTDAALYRKAYLDHLFDRARYYDSLSQKVLNRSVKHVLLLHTNAINAAFLPDVIAMFKSRGWSIVSPGEAFDDPVYSMTTKVLPAGESILWALAKERGIDGLRYPAEDGVYEAPSLDALERK